MKGYNSAEEGVGVFGNVTASDGIGVEGSVDTGIGVEGLSNGAYSVGVEGSATGSDSDGVLGTCSGEYCAGVYGTCTSGTGCVAASFDGTVTITGSGTYSGTWTNSSDERLKQDIAPVKNGMDELLRFRPVTFRWKEPSKHGGLTGVQHGFIAQDVEKIEPEWVVTDRDGFKSIDMKGLHSLEVDAIRQLKTENDELKDRVHYLETGAHPIAATMLPQNFNFNGAGWGLAGVLGTLLFANRKKKAQA